MSAENVQVLRAAYEAFARQDVPAVMAALHEGIEWEAPESLPFGGTYTGHAGVGSFFGQLPQYWDGLTVVPEEFIDGGEAIVVVARVSGRGAAGTYERRHLHLWRMLDGKAVRFTEWSDTATALQALGRGLALPA